MDGNPPANSGDPGSIAGLERYHMLRSNSAGAPQLLKSAHPRACTEPVMGPHAASAEAHVP